MTNEDRAEQAKAGINYAENIEALYTENIAILRHIVRPYVKDGNEADLLQCAFLGIVDSIPGYDRTKGDFFTFAKFHIRNEVKDFLRVSNTPFVIPAHVFDRIGLYKKCVHTLSQRLNRTPTRKEIAGYMMLSERQVEDIQRVLSPVASVEGACGEDDSCSLADIIPDRSQNTEDEATAEVFRENSLSLWAMIEDSVTSRQFEVLRLRYLDGLTIREIAEKYGISRQRVNQIIAKAFSKLLKSHSSAVRLANELEAYGYQNYAGVGFSAFQRRWASAVEMAVIRREDRIDHFSRMIKDVEQNEGGDSYGEDNSSGLGKSGYVGRRSGGLQFHRRY